MAAIVAVQIPDSKNTGYKLLKVIIVGILLRASAYYQFSGLVGYDTVAEITFSEQLISTGFIGDYMGAYQYYPIAHILTVSISQIAGLNIADSFFVLGLIEVISLIFIFLIGKQLFSSKTGLMAALILAVFDWHILWGFYIKAMTLGIALVPVILFLIIGARHEKKFIYTILSILMLFLVILTHTFVTASLLVILLVGWLVSLVLKHGSSDNVLIDNYERPIMLETVLLLGFTTIAYWLYVSGFYSYVSYAVNYALSIDSTIIIASAFQMSAAEILWTRLPIFTMILFTIIGCLSIFNIRLFINRKLNQIWIALLCGFMVIISFIFFSFSEMEMLIRERWLVFTGLIAAIPIARGLLNITGNRKYLSGVSIAVIVFIFSGIMTTSYIANVSSVISWGASRYMAASASELSAAQTISHITSLTSDNNPDNSIIYADHYYSQIFLYEYEVPAQNIVDFSDILTDELERFNGILMLRKSMPDIVSTKNELIMDTARHRGLMQNSQVSLIYDNGTTRALKQR